jgi:hypothetical protein
LQRRGSRRQNESEAAIVPTLIRVLTTVFLTGQNATSGVGLIEVYDLDQGITSELANVSTARLCGHGRQRHDRGIIIGPLGAAEATVIVRAIGPTLAGSGLSHTLADPFLELRDSNGTLVAANDNWQDDPRSGAAALRAKTWHQVILPARVQFTPPCQRAVIPLLFRERITRPEWLWLRLTTSSKSRSLRRERGSAVGKRKGIHEIPSDRIARDGCASLGQEESARKMLE